jgi:hypothetical protein
MPHPVPKEGPLYIVAIYESQVIIGRISWLNLPRAEDLVQRLKGPSGEDLQKWQTGSRAELLSTFPEECGDWSFDDADKAYEANPTAQIMYARPGA